MFKSHDFSYQYQEQATPTPNIGFSKVFFFSSFYDRSFKLLNKKMVAYNVSVSGHERFYDDDDAEWEAVVHI